MNRSGPPARLRRLLVLFGGLAAGCSRSPFEVVALQPAEMNPHGAHISTTTGAVTFLDNGTLQADVPVMMGPITITVQARGTQIDGEAPRVAVQLAGRTVGELSIGSSSLRDYALLAAVEHPGTIPLRVAFENFRRRSNPVEEMTLQIDAVRITAGVVALTPAQMNPLGTYLTDEAGSVTFWGNGELQTEIPTQPGPITLMIRADGAPVAEEFPQLAIELEGRLVDELTIGSRSAADYTITTSIEGSTPAPLHLRFTNYAAASDSLQRRTLHIGAVWIMPGTTLALDHVWPLATVTPTECRPTPTSFDKGNAPPVDSPIAARDSQGRSA